MSDRIPLSVTLKYMIALCAAVWLLIFLFPVYAGIVLAVLTLTGCLISLVLWLTRLYRDAQCKRRLADVRAALAKAQVRRAAASKGLSEPNQSSTVRRINETISALTFEQLQLEAALGKRAA